MTQLHRILQVNKSDRESGAEAICNALHLAYLARGYDAWLAVGTRHTTMPHVKPIPPYSSWNLWASGWAHLAQRLLSAKHSPGSVRLGHLARHLVHPQNFIAKLRGHEPMHYPGTWQLPHLAPGPIDLLHLHNLHGDYFDLRALPWLSRQFPTVVTLHECWLLTGHCVYPLDCPRWNAGCGQCPDLRRYVQVLRDATAANRQRKREIYAQSRLYIATPSRWLMQQVEHSMLMPAIVDARVIHNGIDTDTFVPGSREAARQALGIPVDACVLLFAANGVRQNPYKDYQTLRAAIGRVAERYRARPIYFLALGEDAPDETEGAAVIRFMPFQRDMTTLARYYQAADIYLHAAKGEVWGLTITEALACGIPVVATDVGGIAEQIRAEETGLLVPPADPVRMAEAILDLLAHDDRRVTLGTAAATDAHARFSVARMVDGYLAWYEEILAARANEGVHERHG